MLIVCINLERFYPILLLKPNLGFVEINNDLVITIILKMLDILYYISITIIIEKKRLYLFLAILFLQVLVLNTKAA